MAVRSLAKGEVVVFPTETVYGLGGDATNDLAVAKIYKAKNRPTFNPLIAHFFSIEQLGEYVDLTSTAIDLAQAFWPGPLTLILKRKKNSKLSLLASAGLDCIGARIPNHPVALKLIKAFGKPIVAPSANISSGVSPTSAVDSVAALGMPDLLILDGGKCQVGIESTIVDLSCGAGAIIRPGVITCNDLSRFLKINNIRGDSLAIKSPGQMRRHYSPNSMIRLNASNFGPGEALLAFGDAGKIISSCPDIGNRYLNLSESGDLSEAAANLFAMLRKLDQLNPTAIAIMPIPNKGIGIAINDRLTRAASR